MCGKSQSRQKSPLSMGAHTEAEVESLNCNRYWNIHHIWVMYGFYGLLRELLQSLYRSVFVHWIALWVFTVHVLSDWQRRFIHLLVLCLCGVVHELAAHRVHPATLLLSHCPLNLASSDKGSHFQWKKVSNWLMNTSEHWAAKDPHIFLRSWWRPDQSTEPRRIEKRNLCARFPDFSCFFCTILV